MKDGELSSWAPGNHHCQEENRRKGKILKALGQTMGSNAGAGWGSRGEED